MLGYKKKSPFESFKGNNPEKEFIFIVFRLLLSLEENANSSEIMLLRRKQIVKSFTVLQTLYFFPLHLSAYLVFLRWRWSASEETSRHNNSSCSKKENSIIKGVKRHKHLHTFSCLPPSSFDFSLILKSLVLAFVLFLHFHTLRDFLIKLDVEMKLVLTSEKILFKLVLFPSAVQRISRISISHLTNMESYNFSLRMLSHLLFG